MADDRKPKEQQGLPEGWKWVRLGDILKYEQPQKYIVISDEYDEKSGIPVLTAGKTFILGYVDENKGICNDLPVILFDDFTTDSRFIDFPFKVKSSATKILRARDESIDLFYVYNALKLIRLKPSSDHKRFWISEYSKMPIPLPPLPEQRKIAQILETVDNAIEKTEKIIEKYKRIKQGLMQDLLTKGIDEKGNIRSEKTHKFKDSPLGRIPEEWEVVRLGEVSKVKRGASPRPIDDPIFFTEEGKGRAWVRIEDVMKSNKYLTETRQYLSKLGESKSVKVDVGEVVMSICATVGKPIIINIPACIHDGFVVFKNLSCKVDRHFLYYLITFKEKEIAKLGQIGTQGNLNSKIVSDFRIPLPPLSEQKRIAEILSQIDQAIEKEEKYKQKLERLKKGLMEDLLTGKVRVNKLLEGEVNEMA
jgi:type I restriction enzyme S subunit